MRDGDGLTKKQHRATLELFQSEIAPVLRREIPSRPFLPAPACVTRSTVRNEEFRKDGLICSLYQASIICI